MSLVPSRWRFEPLPSSAVGRPESPFRVRGLAYVSALDYVNRHTPGGLPVIERRLGDESGFYRQLFVAMGSYEAPPLLRLLAAAAAVEGLPMGRFISDRARGSAKADAEGIWKPLYSARSLPQMIERTPVAFNRYYEPCRARVTNIEAQAFAGELANVPESMDGLYVYSTEGFVGTCLERAGAANVAFDWSRPEPSGQVDGIRVELLRFRAKWGAGRQNAPNTPA